MLVAIFICGLPTLPPYPHYGPPGLSATTARPGYSALSPALVLVRRFARLDRA